MRARATGRAGSPPAPRSVGPRSLLALAFLSGIPALVFEVLWTREVALRVAGEVGAISAVLAVFFAGLALGARLLAGLADRAAEPLRVYAALELAAGLLGALSLPLLRALHGTALAGAPEPLRLAASCLLLLPVTFLLGGTLPALLRAAVRAPGEVPRRAGLLVGANTAGSVLGVGAAAFAIPALGLLATGLLAGGAGAAVGGAALLLARGGARAPAPQQEAEPEADRGTAADGWRRAALGAAAAAGLATLAFEVLVARSAALLLGSSLPAWAAVLALVLLGLAAGNALAARRAARSPAPLRDLGWIEIGAALCLAPAVALARATLARPAAGVVPESLLLVAVAVLPAALCMGAAFPYFVRLARFGDALPQRQVARDFGAVSAANTAGGIAGALLAPFALLPALGLAGAILFCLALNAGLGGAFLLGAAPPARARRAGARARGMARAGVGWAAVGLAAAAALAAPRLPGAERAIYVAEGSQATAVVLHTGGGRELLVDGDPEASSRGAARQTEELLAVLPLLLHPEPQRFFEVGLGLGITLGTAARFPLERIECVELAGSVIRAARFFAPENGGVAGAAGPRVRIGQGDARAHLALRRASFDVVAANTVHPWSLGATGLYSREYFERVAAALRPGGLAVQWLPLERIGARSLAAILRSFQAAFPEGGLWWGAGNLLAVGSAEPLARLEPARAAARLAAAGLSPEALGLRNAGELAERRLADAAALRAALGAGPLLRDDRPQLEAWGWGGRAAGERSEVLSLLVRIAEAGARSDPAAGPLWLFAQALEARAAGDPERADRLEALVDASGRPWARQARLTRLLESAERELAAGRGEAAQDLLEQALDLDPGARGARFGLAALAFQRGDPAPAARRLEALLERQPNDAEAWNLLGVIRSQRGELAPAREAFERALGADPHLPQALANAGLLAARAGNRASALAQLARLRALSPLGPRPEARALAAALRE